MLARTSAPPCGAHGLLNCRFDFTQARDGHASAAARKRADGHNIIDWRAGGTFRPRRQKCMIFGRTCGQQTA